MEDLFKDIDNIEMSNLANAYINNDIKPFKVFIEKIEKKYGIRRYDCVDIVREMFVKKCLLRFIELNANKGE